MVAPKRDPDIDERATIPPPGAGFNDMRHKSLFAIRCSPFAVRVRLVTELSTVNHQPSPARFAGVKQRRDQRRSHSLRKTISQQTTDTHPTSGPGESGLDG
jgi:hypothetical protein